MEVIFFFSRCSCLVGLNYSKASSGNSENLTVLVAVCTYLDS